MSFAARTECAPYRGLKHQTKLLPRAATTERRPPRETAAFLLFALFVLFVANLDGSAHVPHPRPEVAGYL
jgi:hypothetical protein